MSELCLKSLSSLALCPPDKSNPLYWPSGTVAKVKSGGLWQTARQGRTIIAHGFIRGSRKRLPLTRFPVAVSSCARWFDRAQEETATGLWCHLRPTPMDESMGYDCGARSTGAISPWQSIVPPFGDCHAFSTPFRATPVSIAYGDVPAKKKADGHRSTHLPRAASGTVQRLEEVDSNQILTVKEPAKE